MAFNKVTLNPGVNIQQTPTLNQATWAQSQLMRFQNGLPQKLGGWAQQCATAVTGTARGSHSWADLLGNAYYAIGSEQRLEVLTGGTLYDITPIRATTNPSPSFSTVSTSATVKVTDTANGAAVGDWIYLNVPVSVGGIVLQGFYQVTALVDANNYDIVAASAATSTVNNGGAVPKFTTTNTSATVKVTLNNHGYATNATFNVQVSTTVGGLTLSGAYAVGTIVDANDFDITASTTATSGANAFENSGDAQIAYLLASGLASNTGASGYGIGNYGSGLYGIGSSSGSYITPLRQWLMDNWGQDLVANYSMGGIYYWVPPPATVPTNPALPVPNSPSQNNTIFVMMPAQILVSGGCTNLSSTFDPNLVRWCDVGDFTDWTASTTNQAGSFRIPTGSKIVGSLLGQSQGLIWTDRDLWTQTYIGFPLVFSFNSVSTNCGLIAAQARGLLNSTVFWMGVDNFYAYAGGGVQVVPCTVWDQIFRNLNTAQTNKIFVAIDPPFNEIWWFYPSAASNEVDSYVKFNMAEQTWDYGTLTRTTWDAAAIFGAPLAVDGSGIIQQHEVANDANGQPLSYSFTTGFFDVAQGEEFIFIDRLIPDFDTVGTNATIQVTITSADYPGGPSYTYGPYFLTTATPYISLRLRGRQAQIQFSGNDVGSFVRLGAVRYRGAVDGRR